MAMPRGRVWAVLAVAAVGVVGVGVAVWALLQAAPELVAGSAGEEALWQAARDGRREALVALLAAGVDSEQRDEDGNTALLLAAKGGHTKCFAPLLQALPSTRDKIDAMKDVINITTDWEILQALGKALGDALTGGEGLEALKEANGNGSCDFVRSLLAAGVNASRELLEAAADRGFTECVQWLREAGAPPLSGREWEKKLRDAARGGRREMLVALLAAGVPVDAADYDGLTALILAAGFGHADCGTELLKAGADKDRMDTGGYTVLMWASWKGHVDMVKVLLAASANVNAANKYGDTALIDASIEGHEEVVEELLAANADVDARNRDGDTALHKAALMNHAETVRVLLRNGADKSIRNNEGKLPLALTTSDEVRRLLRP